MKTVSRTRTSAVQKNARSAFVAERQVVRRQAEVVVEPVAEPGPVDRRDPARAVRDVVAEQAVAVPRDLGHDLAEAERHDREVVAAQAERGQADENSDDRRRDARHDQDEPDREVEARHVRRDADRAEADVLRGELRRGEPAGHVGAHRVERDVAEVEQPGVADDEVQAEGHHREDGHSDHRAHLRHGPEDRQLRHGRRAAVERVGDREREHRQRNYRLADRPAAEVESLVGGNDDGQDDCGAHQGGCLPHAEERDEHQADRGHVTAFTMRRVRGVSPCQRSGLRPTADRADHQAPEIAFLTPPRTVRRLPACARPTSLPA